jgi:hypothetical protein
LSGFPLWTDEQLRGRVEVKTASVSNGGSSSLAAKYLSYMADEVKKLLVIKNLNKIK